MLFSSFNLVSVWVYVFACMCTCVRVIVCICMFLHISVTLATISCLRLFWYIPIIFGFLLKHFWYSPCSLLILPKHLTLASCDPLFLWLCYLDNVSFYITSLNEREKEEVCTHQLSNFQKQFWLWTFKGRCMPIDI